MEKLGRNGFYSVLDKKAMVKEYYFIMDKRLFKSKSCKMGEIVFIDEKDFILDVLKGKLESFEVRYLGSQAISFYVLEDESVLTNVNFAYLSGVNKVVQINNRKRITTREITTELKVLSL